MKHYKAIFFDWDGTAVLSRKAPVEDAVNAMRPLLDKGVKLCIVSGTTYENITAILRRSSWKTCISVWGAARSTVGMMPQGSRPSLLTVCRMPRASLPYTMPATASTASCWKNTA